tara:strand:+ start:38093 stop:38875 length:783 start_codon:yes stop_codon:yes gene_type:complete
MELTVKDTFKRSVLGEGRRYGVGFAFVAPSCINTTKSFKALMPFSTCKDYLNDLAYCEHHNEELKEAYGFEHKYTGIFKGKEYVFLGVKILNYNSIPNNSWKEYEEAFNLFMGNRSNMLTVVNKFEERVNLTEDRITIKGITKDTIVLKIPYIWFTNIAAVSALSLCIRCFFNVSKEDAAFGFDKILDVHSKKLLIKPDSMMINTLHRLLKEDNLKEKFAEEFPKELKRTEEGKIKDVMKIHSSGLVTFLSSIKKKTKIC